MTPGMRDDAAFAGWVAERQLRIEAVLEAALPTEHSPSPRLASAMRYATLGGGKRMRPLLAYAASELTDANEHAVDRCAAAVELVHAYSLIHDDLPCMDDDALRRGKPSCHVAYDVARAMRCNRSRSPCWAAVMRLPAAAACSPNAPDMRAWRAGSSSISTRPAACSMLNRLRGSIG
jgi:hypothetical protein